MSFQCHNRFQRSITIFSRAASGRQNLLHVLPAILECSLMVVELLLEVGDLGGSLRALASETLVDGADGDVDEPNFVGGQLLTLYYIHDYFHRGPVGDPNRCLNAGSEER